MNPQPASFAGGGSSDHPLECTMSFKDIASVAML